jgi:hypothetical protein
MCAGRIKGLILGLILVVAGLAVMFFFARVAELECSRPEPSTVQCVKEIKWLGVVSMNKETIRDVRGAQVDESCDEDGCTYRVRVIASQGDVPLTGYYSSGRSAKERTADQINAYVARGGEEPLTVSDGSVILGALVGGAFAVAGLIAAVAGVLGRVR